MKNIFKIAWRNLFRYKRRTALTGSLIALGVSLVIVFTGVGNSFKNAVTERITNSNLGHIQIHRDGYVSSIDSQPLNKGIGTQDIRKLEVVIKTLPSVQAYSKRIRFAGMISNYESTANVRLIGIIPDMEGQTCPELPARILEGRPKEPQFITRGEVLLPVAIANGMNLKVGSDMVIIATNKDGAVNGLNLKVGGISENLMGPSGKDVYLHYADAQELLRIEGEESNEVVLKLTQLDDLNKAATQLKTALQPMKTTTGQPMFEVHTWEELSPLITIMHLVDILIGIIRMVLIGIVLISVMNVMMMSVYERISEIGTIASIGTPPRRILALFLMEGVSLGFLSSIGGSLIGIGILMVLYALKPTLNIAHVLMTIAPTTSVGEVLTPILLVIVISVVSGFQPALKASRLEPVEALRHV